MFPLDGQQPEMLDPEVMDRYLRQEESDPISVISFDPEEEHGDARAHWVTPLTTASGKSESPAAAGINARASELPAVPVVPPAKQVTPVTTVAVPAKQAATGSAAVIDLPIVQFDPAHPPLDAMTVSAPECEEDEEPAAMPGLAANMASSDVVAPGNVAAQPVQAAETISAGNADSLEQRLNRLTGIGMRSAAPKAGGWQKTLLRLKQNTSYLLLCAGVILFSAPLFARLMHWLMQ
jgi:hypothetical protein